MKCTGEIVGLSMDWKDSQPVVQVKIHGNYFETLQTLNGTKLSVSLSKWRNKRSLDANAYMWVLLQKLAEKLNSDKDSIYLTMLRRYGRFTHIIVKPEMVEAVQREWKTSEVLGDVFVNGTAGVQIRCYFGSHTYDTKEMAVLIDGVVSECKECGIETMTPDELKRLKEKWGR